MDELYINNRIRINCRQVIFLKRRLLGVKNCHFLVRPSQEVGPADLIAEGETAVGFRTFHLASKLNVRPSEAEGFLKRKIGQKIYEGEILASREGLFGLSKSNILSPLDGLLELYDKQSGDLRIRLLPKKEKLISGVYGIVEKVSPDTAAVMIKTMVDLVYGVAGSGRKREGILSILDSSDSLISAKQVVALYQNQIVVGGAIIFADALSEVMNLKIKGVITGGINAGDFRKMVGGKWNIINKSWFDNGLSLMVTEGFGSVSIGEDIFAVLRLHNGQLAILDGNRSMLVLPSTDPNSMIYIRKTSIPSGKDVDIIPEAELVKLSVGCRVRVISMPELGKQGSIEAIDQTPTLLPSGIKTYLVTVSSITGKIRVPYLNLEVIG